MDSVICHYTGGEIVDEVITGNGYCGHHKEYILLLTIPALPISWIETYTILSYFSAFGVMMATIGMLCMFGMLFKRMGEGDIV